MRFIIETISGRKGIKNFENINEYVDFMTKNGNKIKDIFEADMPYDDKPVKLSDVTTSDGWKQIDSSAFGKINSKAEKGDCILPTKSKSVFKDEAKFEPTKSSEKEDSSSSNVKVKSQTNSESKSETEKEVEKDLPKFKYEDDNKSDDKENKSEEKEKNKKIDEAVETQPDMFDNEYDTNYVDGVQTYTFHEINDFMSQIAPNLSYTNDDEQNGKVYLGYWGNNLSFNEYKRIAQEIKNKFNGNVQAHLARAQYSPEQKTLYISYTPTPDDEQELTEDFKNGLKKAGKYVKGALAGAAMAGALAGNAHAMEDPYYDGATQPFDSSYEQVQDDSDMPQIKAVKSDGTIVDQYGNEYTKEEFEALKRGEDPYYDGAKQPFGESENFDDEIKESLRIAGVELNEDYYNQANDEIDDGQDIDDEKVIDSIEQIMQDKGISEEEAVQEYINFSGMDENIVQDIWNDYKSYSEQANNEEDGKPDEKSGKKKLFEEDPLEEAPMSDEDFDSLEDGDKVNWDLSKYDGNYTVKKDGDKINFMGDDGQGNQFDMGRQKDYVKKYFSKGHKESPDKDSVQYAEDMVKSLIHDKEMAEYDDFAYTNGRMSRINRNLDFWTDELEKRRARDAKLNESEEEPLEEEITPSRLWKYQEHPEMNFAILSADRSERTPEENKEKSEELKKDIKSMGYWYTELKGGYVEVGKNGKRVPVDGEDSFIVPNMTKEEAMELGKKYDQDTVMFKDAKAHTLQYIITNERAGNIGDADSSFETQAGKDNFSVSSGNNLDYYSRLPKSNKKDLKIGFNWKE